MNFCSEGSTGNVSAYCIAVPQCSDGCHNGLWISRIWIWVICRRILEREARVVWSSHLPL